MKAVLISIHPKWCEKIFNGEKTIEVRKTAPKLETPFTVYVYQTKTRNAGNAFANHWSDCLELPNGEFVNAGGKVIGSFVCDRVEEYTFSGYNARYRINDADLAKTCLNHPELISYGKGKDLHGWHISDLKIYDKPKELGGFSYPAEHNFTKRTIKESREMGFICHGVYITRPPQSWCYVEVKK